jgi:hypothetical protein
MQVFKGPLAGVFVYLDDDELGEVEDSLQATRRDV